jgi:hypothetical protein
MGTVTFCCSIDIHISFVGEHQDKQASRDDLEGAPSAFHLIGKSPLKLL